MLREEHALVSTRHGGDKESHPSEPGGDTVAEEHPKDRSWSQRAPGMFPSFTVQSAASRGQLGSACVVPGRGPI